MSPTIFLFLVAGASAASVGSLDNFNPAHRLTGIGVDRHELTPELLNERVRLMQDAQTFFFLREPGAVQGADRIESPTLAPIFNDAARQSGLPVSLIKAIAYLESFGDPNAVSPAGCCRGIMQISGPTAKDMGLHIFFATKYHIVTEKKSYKNKKGKTLHRTVTRKIPYQVMWRDERLIPEKAIPAAANYLARIQRNFGGLDWAVFAYHCGVGCVGNMHALTEQAKGLAKPVTVAGMFFGSSPVLNQELYQAVRREMERDWSPTYWFRVMRAEQLLNLYREDKPAFLELAGYYRYDSDPNTRAQHRLAVWLKPNDMLFQSSEDLIREKGKRLAKIIDDPDFFGFRVDKAAIVSLDPDHGDSYMQATPAALGTLIYIAYETRRMHEAMRPKGEKFAPLEVTSLVRAMTTIGRDNGTAAQPSEAAAHISGQVFDIRYSTLPPGEKEALQFVLDDMGYEGYLGFIDETPNSGTMHIGCSPSSRDFFTQVYQDALAAKH